MKSVVINIHSGSKGIYFSKTLSNTVDDNLWWHLYSIRLEKLTGPLSRLINLTEVRVLLK